MEHQISDTLRIMEQTKALMVEEDNIRRKVKYLGWAFPLLIILIFITYFSMFYSTITNVDKEKFFARFEQKSANILPEIARELQRLGSVLLPVYTAELEKAIAGDVPGLEVKLTSEMEKFKKTFDDKVSVNFTNALSSVKENQKAILVSEFPELEGDPEKTALIQAALQNSMMDWIKGLLLTTLEEHAVAFIDLKKVLDKGYKLDKSVKESIDTEGLASLWLEILNSTLHGEETIIKPEKNR